MDPRSFLRRRERRRRVVASAARELREGLFRELSRAERGEVSRELRSCCCPSSRLRATSRLGVAGTRLELRLEVLHAESL